MLTTNQIREEFLRFFESKNHRRLPSSSLVPAGDPTLLFTNAGMNQFKDVFLGREKRAYSRATTSQKCVRAGGKHNDLENVGRTARHHTFFEMLGNFSFGDYFKQDAIDFAWELMTKVYGLEVERLWFSVFEGDDQVPADEDAVALWIRAGASPDRVLRFGRKDNFWSMGDTGPCGPCSEIHYFRGSDMSKNVASLVNGEGDDTMEIWNLVFMQYDRNAEGVLTPLPAPSVDTGMGLERLAGVLQGADSNYDSDLFAGLISEISRIGGTSYTKDMAGASDTAIRVLADHARASSFLIADGVIPANEGRGYVLRRIIRRAIRFGRKLPNAVLLSQLVDTLNESMGEAYPELTQRREAIIQTLRAEEERFSRTLNVGMERVGQLLDEVRSRGERSLGGEEVFRLYDTFGIPIDLVTELGEEEGVTIDREGFEELMKSARAKAKASSKFQSSADDALLAQLAETIGPVEFVGYDAMSDVQSTVRGLVFEGKERDKLAQGEEGIVVITPTPFYAESGGQVADKGTLTWTGGHAQVLDTQRPVGELIVSRVRVLEGILESGQQVIASVPVDERLDTTANHTGTHLLHKALKDVLGETVQQAGSLVAPDRFRFDYSYNKALRDDEIETLERIVNDAIRRNLDVSKRVMSLSEAKESGAVAMFDEKYGERVRVVSAGDFSSELCGGCHVNRTGDIGFFKILSDRSLAAGVRRIEAVTGRRAVEYVQELDGNARILQQQLNVPLNEVSTFVRSLQEKQKGLEKELKALKLKAATGGNGSGLESRGDESVEVSGVRLLTRRVDDVAGGDLRNLADSLRSRLKSGVVLLGSVVDGKTTLLAAVTADLTGRLSAHQLIQKLAPVVGGKGGGKPELAQAGGKDPVKLDEALEGAAEVMREMLAAS
ncbi:MAG TPA: alanine--tRNA ligase [Thermoanaerobaculia bacterium]|nr:alanine--tRNA ligase [Thermoanaerobaculia bacterium]